MYLVGKLLETKKAHLIQIQVADGVVGYLPVFKNKKKALKHASSKYPLFEGLIKEIKAQEI